MKKPKIVVVGSSNSDMVVCCPRLPARGETVLGGDFLLAAGGKGANQAVAAARLGAEVFLIARVGADIFGEQTLVNLEKEGIDVRFVRQEAEAASGVALIVVEEGGENMIAVAPGANSRLDRSDIDAASRVIGEADALLLQLEVPLDTVRYAAETGRERGTRVILNPAPAQALDRVLLENITILTPNRQEAALLSGLDPAVEIPPQEVAEALHRLGAATVVLTLGKAGALMSGKTGVLSVPSPAVQAIDATAAGDAFNGALAFSIARGWELPNAVAFANCAGAIAATRLGAQPSLPSLVEVEQLMGSRPAATGGGI